MNRVERYGRHAFLVTPPGGVSALALAAAVDAGRPHGAIDVVPAAATVLVTFDAALPTSTLDDVAAWLAALSPADGDTDRGAEVVEIDVDYDGADLAEVARHTGLSAREVVRRHSGATYRCQFCGFAPGFAYLSGLDPALTLPRRASPRPSVPAGSVAIADGYTAVYPTASPGGWHLLGRTDAVLWDVAATPPATIRPGTLVRFRRSGRGASHSSIWARPAPDPGLSAPRSGVGGALEVIAAGWSTSVQDGGRPGFAHLGVPRAGAVAPARRDTLNRLLGNLPDAAVLETAGGLRLRARRPVVVADSTGQAVTTIAAGGTCSIDPRPGELWATLAVRGGIAVPPVLGSRSWDSLSKLGPPPPRAGDHLAVGDDPRTTIDAVLLPSRADSRAVRVEPGPRRDWFTDAAWEALLAARWHVADEVSRVGVRLVGPRLDRIAARGGRELATEGLVLGAVQVPPNGQPVVMLADHPTTGGYPVIAVVDDRDVDMIACLRPGAPVSFTAP